MNLRHVLFGVSLAIATVPVVPSTAWAGGGDGATVVRQQFCDTTTFAPSTVCYDLNYVRNETQTPSGNISFVTKGENTITQTTVTGCTFTGHTEFHRHYLLKGDTMQEQGDRETNWFTADCFGHSMTCTYTLEAHYANGEFQYFQPQFICTANPA